MAEPDKRAAETANIQDMAEGRRTFRLEIVTPDRIFYSGEAESVIVSTVTGERGIMKGHIPMVTCVDAGTVKIRNGNDWKEAVITEGFMEIKQDSMVLLTDTAEWPSEIDRNRAEAAKIRAEERLHKQLSQIEYVRSKAAMARAMARLKVSGKRGK